MSDISIKPFSIFPNKHSFNTSSLLNKLPYSNHYYTTFDNTINPNKLSIPLQIPPLKYGKENINEKSASNDNTKGLGLKRKRSLRDTFVYKFQKVFNPNTNTISKNLITRNIAKLHSNSKKLDYVTLSEYIDPINEVNYCSTSLRFKHKDHDDFIETNYNNYNDKDIEEGNWFIVTKSTGKKLNKNGILGIIFPYYNNWLMEIWSKNRQLSWNLGHLKHLSLNDDDEIIEIHENYGRKSDLLQNFNEDEYYKNWLERKYNQLNKKMIISPELNLNHQIFCDWVDQQELVNWDIADSLV